MQWKIKTHVFWSRNPKITRVHGLGLQPGTGPLTLYMGFQKPRYKIPPRKQKPDIESRPSDQNRTSNPGHQTKTGHQIPPVRPTILSTKDLGCRAASSLKGLRARMGLAEVVLRLGTQECSPRRRAFKSTKQDQLCFAVKFAGRIFPF